MTEGAPSQKGGSLATLLPTSDNFIFRWWQYQVWAEHFSLIGAPFPISNDLHDAQFSMTYGPDVGQAVLKTLQLGRTNQVGTLQRSNVLTNALIDSMHRNSVSCINKTKNGCIPKLV